MIALKEQSFALLKFDLHLTYTVPFINDSDSKKTAAENLSKVSPL